MYNAEHFQYLFLLHFQLHSHWQLRFICLRLLRTVNVCFIRFECFAFARRAECLLCQYDEAIFLGGRIEMFYAKIMYFFFPLFCHLPVVGCTYTPSACSRQPVLRVQKWTEHDSYIRHSTEGTCPESFQSSFPAGRCACPWLWHSPCRILLWL